MTPIEIAARKESLRSAMQERRATLAAALRKRYSLAICENLLSLPRIQAAPCVHVYCSFASEPDSFMVMRRLFDLNKRILIPLVSADNSRELRHAEILPDERFGTGRFGIPVPERTPDYCDAAATLTPDDCVVVPLLAFDRQLRRLGYGKGYYDRFLARTSAWRIGLAFAALECPEVPSDRHDIPLHQIVTEQGILSADV